MAQAKSKTRSGKEFKEENENEDLEKLASMMKEKDSSKESKLKPEESGMSDFINLMQFMVQQEQKREQERREEKERYEKEITCQLWKATIMRGTT